MRQPPSFFAFTTPDGVFQVWKYSRYRRGRPFVVVEACVAYNDHDYHSPAAKRLRKKYGWGEVLMPMAVDLDAYLNTTYFQIHEPSDFDYAIPQPVLDWIRKNISLLDAVRAQSKRLAL